MINLNYDTKNDILYLAFANKDFSYGDEVVDGCVVMMDSSSDEIAGVTIFDFMDKYNADRRKLIALLSNGLIFCCSISFLLQEYDSTF